MQIQIKNASRPCDGCTKCCEGWLSGKAYGHDFTSNPCRFLNKGCSIYPVRPDVCKGFECEWKYDKSIPLLLKPDIVNAIILKRFVDVHEYYFVVSTSELIDKRVVDWAENFSQASNLNHVLIDHRIVYTIHSKNENFRIAIKEKFNITD